YTAVDKAESDKESAHRVNAEAPGVIAAACRRNNSKLIHISTDYVFNGNGQRPYKEDDPTDPVNYYGESKLLGEQQVMLHNPGSIIIRTAWVYSQFGKNFVKTILRLVGEKEAINVVSDQYGTPTYAADLAEAIMQIITILDSETDATGASHAGIYHFSNDGVINWHQFALAIRDISGSKCKVNPIPASDYPTPARRPAYSVLDKSKISTEFNISIKPWRESLEVCIKRIDK
ncbi:MAG TPA: dTDP-4-dehydrorhamnose reductase, partial [Chitinophagaceae bacterium]|nr:dTDP-4-dehydrorhamnose reductase [Chitinophagaceae bacterium]